MKMKQWLALSVAVLLVVSTTACSQNGGRDGGIRKQDIGTIAGAIGGALVGENVGKGKGKTLGIAAGTLLGAYIGGEVGASLDRADMAYYNQSSQAALETNRTGVTSSWKNPDSGNSGTITPTKTYQTAQGAFCREYTQTINVGGKNAEGYGTACRQPDGSWQIRQ